jgi:hypothetical protein
LRFDRPLAVTFTFSDRGGYVALAKHYQRHFQRWGYARTLREKQAENPAVERLFGAGVYWVYGTAEEVLAVARMMHVDGIDRAIFEIAAPYWHCPTRYEPDKNLWSVLYGNVPMFFLDRAHYETHRRQIAQTHQYVCGWTRRVADAEMTAHRFVTPDRQIQESLFSNRMGVVVNFGKEVCRLPDGQVIPGRSYRSFVEGKARTYSRPPVAEISYQEAP